MNFIQRNSYDGGSLPELAHRGALERVNAWFATRGRMQLILASGGLGTYLITVGVVELAE